MKEHVPFGILVLFNVMSESSERYERWAGISIGVDLCQDVIIDAVSKRFDEREVSKNIRTHERYFIFKSKNSKTLLYITLIFLFLVQRYYCLTHS